ncbi:MAG: RNA methyltransferase [Treponema sp.]|jgi:TrmH RNA methyltransferase|nr:RNA methyltransferase [Treponema sp.]
MLNKMTDELAICGMNAVLAAAEYHPENINRLFLREDRLKSFYGICKQLAERKRPYKMCGDEELERICKSSRHQGVVAMIKAPAPEAMSREDLGSWAAERKTGLVLHDIWNDHNLGAIARSAAFFDAPWIVVSDVPASKDESQQPSAPCLSTSAYRVAEGGMEHVRVRFVRNTAAFLKEASRKIITIGTDIRARQRLRDLPAIIKSKSETLKDAVNLAGARPGIAIVLGNEETGLPAEVKEACSCLVRIPGTGLMECLNVSQVAALFLNEIFQN